jgi:hypothetical protein
MTHPLLNLSSSDRRLALFASSALTLLGLIVLGVADPGRVVGKGPRVVGFQLAGSAARAQKIMSDWGERGRTVAAFNLGFDYLFIVGYSTLMTLLCLWASHRYRQPILLTAGVFIAWLQWLAGALDCTEDAFLLHMLFSGPSDAAAQIARVSSVSKFGLLLLGLLYVISSLF